MVTNQNQNSTRGRSRLKTKQPQTSLNKSRRSASKITQRFTLTISPGYALLALICLAILYFLVSYFHPEQLADFIWPNSFLPIILSSCGLVFSILKTGKVNKQLALSVALELSLLLWLLLQDLSINWWWILVLMIVPSCHLLFEQIRQRLYNKSS